MDALVQLLPLVLFIGIFWLIFVRPQTKKRREVAQMQNSLAVGDRVYLLSGIYGTVREISADRVDVEVADSVVVEVARAAIGGTDNAPVEDDDQLAEAHDDDLNDADDTDAGADGTEDPR